MRYSVLYFHCRLRRCIAGPFSPDMQVSSHMFAITHDARLIITAGHWDNSLRVFATRSIPHNLWSRCGSTQNRRVCVLSFTPPWS